MADNIELASGSGGAIVRTDDDGTAHWQYFKLAYGADDTQNIVTSTGTNPLPVALSDTDNAVLDSIQTAVETLDNAISGSEMQVDVVGALPTGSNTIGDVTISGDALTALQLLDDVIYVDDADWSDGSSKHMLVGGLYQSSPQSITDGDVGPLQVDSNGRLIVSPGTALDVSGATVTVSGTVTADLGATDNAVLDAIQTAVELIDNAISGSEMQVDIVSGDVTNAGTFVVQEDGAALTALQLIDNIVLAEDAAHQTGDSGVMALAVRQDTQSDFGADGDYVPLSIDANGALRVTGGGGGTEYTEDDAAPANPTGSAILAERDDALGGLTPVEGDWTHLYVDADGALWVKPSGTVNIQEASALDVSAATVTVDLGANNDVTIDGSNVVFAHDAAGGTANGIMGMSQRDDEVGGTAIATADGDAQSLRSNQFGELKVTQIPDSTSEYKYAAINAASGDNTIVAAVSAGVKVRVLACFLINTTADATARFEDGAGGTALTGIMPLAANGGFVLPFNPAGWFETGDNTLLNLEATGDMDGAITYVEI